MSLRGHCILSHGFESGPDATKVTALSEAAASLGWTHARPDYSDLDAMRDKGEHGDVPARLERLLVLARDAAARGPLVLAGSSLGAFVSGLASLQVPVAALFLMAPPIRMGQAHPLDAAPVPISIIHGWHDELIPAQHVVDWARPRNARLLLVDDSHRLTDHVAASADAFATLLSSLAGMKFFASCPKGLEYLLADELLALGCARATATVSGVNCDGTLHDAQRAVLWSRLASRVLWPLAEFDCPDEHALYEGACAIAWTDHLDASMTLAVDAHVSGDAITHARYAALRVKDAVVDTLRAQGGERPNVDVESPDLRLNLVVRKGRAIVSVDLGGGPLHRRGWRRAQGEAPLKENLAAAVLLRGGWPQVYADGGALIDPMCGSGTLLIEGALMAADVAPSLARYADAPPTRWQGFDADAWNALVADAQLRERAGRGALRNVFDGSDLDPHAIRAARENATAAGLRDAIRFDVRDVAVLPVQSTPRGLAVCNPPYDARLAADPALYRALGSGLARAVPGWRASLLCGDAELAHATGLRAGKKYQLFNGAIECSLIVCDPVRPPQRDAADARALSDGAQMLANRLRKNLRALKSWRAREGVDCCRVYDADLPEYAAAIDLYTEADDPGSRWLHVQEYAAPAEIPEADVRRRFGEVLAAVRDVFALPRERIATKTRMRGKGGSKYSDVAGRRGVEGAEHLVVREGAARLRVNLFDYLDTGLFLDHRPLRARIAAEARGRRVLNLFCYTGAATVQAAVGGAAQTTSVDLSATYLQWLSDNLQENGLGGADHRLVQADALAWLEADRERYDLVFCDPPTFSNSARADDFEVQRDHVRLLRAAVARLSQGGVLYFSNNFRRFRLDTDAIAAFADCEDISAQTIPPDFVRNQRIHRAWRLVAV